jgi:SPP1 family predicted phage head-tail adaptor
MNPGKLDRQITLLKPVVSTENAEALEVSFETRVSNDFGETEDSAIAGALSDLGGVSNDLYGEAVVTFETLANVWANVAYRNTGTGQEEEEAEKEQAVDKVSFTIRYRSDVNTGQRVSYNGNTYNIRSISEVGRKRFLELKAEGRE